MSRRRVVAAALVILAAVLMTLELVLRLVVSNAELSPRVFTPLPQPLLYGLAPDASERVFQFGRVINILTDSEGHRTCGTVRLDSGARIVHVIGDSMIFGWGLDNEEAIPCVVQRDLGPKWRVINHGVPGYGPFEYLHVIQSIPTSEYVVVVFAEENDLWDAYRIFRTAGSTCGYLTELSHGDSTLKCAILRSRTLQFGLAQYRRIRTLGYRPTPLQYGSDSQVAATVMASRVQAAFGPQWLLRGSMMITTVAPWKGLFSEQALAEYYPPSIVRRPVGFKDELNMTDLFRQVPGSKAVLFIEGDSHLSHSGAALIAHRIADELHRRCGC
jgi:hypothetical protein